MCNVLSEPSLMHFIPLSFPSVFVPVFSDSVTWFRQFTMELNLEIVSIIIYVEFALFIILCSKLFFFKKRYKVIKD